MCKSLFIDLPLGPGQRGAFVDGSLASWADGYAQDKQALVSDVSTELRKYVDTFFQNDCRWDGLYPVIDGNAERLEFFWVGLLHLWLEFNQVAVGNAISSMQPDWGYKSRPEWSYQQSFRTSDFFEGFIADVKAQMHLGHGGESTSGEEKPPVILH